MSERETIRVWIQLPLGGTHEHKVALAEAFADTVAPHASISIREGSDDALGLAIDVTAVMANAVVANTGGPITALDAIVADAIDKVMEAHPDGLLTYESVG